MLYAPDQNWTRLSRRPLVRTMNAALRKEVDYMRMQFEIPGRIGGKERPRVNCKAGRVYTPTRTKNAETMIGLIAKIAMAGRAPIPGAVSIDIDIQRLPPVSWRHEHKTEGWATMRPDADNQAKLICDSINGIVWEDDCQVAKLSMTRRYSTGPERAIVTIETLD